MWVYVCFIYASRGTGESIWYLSQLSSVLEISKKLRYRKTVYLVVQCSLFYRDLNKKITCLLCPWTFSFPVICSLCSLLFFKGRYDYFIPLLKLFSLAPGCKFSKRIHALQKRERPLGLSNSTCFHLILPLTSCISLKMTYCNCTHCYHLLSE